MSPTTLSFGALILSLCLAGNSQGQSSEKALLDLAMRYNSATSALRESDALAGVTSLKVFDIAIDPPFQGVASPPTVLNLFTESYRQVGVSVGSDSPTLLHVAVESTVLNGMIAFVCTVEILRNVPIEVDGKFKVVPVILWERRSLHAATEGGLKEAVGRALTSLARKSAEAFAEAKRNTPSPARKVTDY